MTRSGEELLATARRRGSQLRRRRRSAWLGVGGLATALIVTAAVLLAVPGGSPQRVQTIGGPPTTPPSLTTPPTVPPTTSTTTDPLSTPVVTMSYFGSGVALLGVDVEQSTAPVSPQLFLTTDQVHWRNVTPPGASTPDRVGAYGGFDQASFLNATTGWVTEFDGNVDQQTIFRTSDGGATWTLVPGFGHSLGGEDTSRIQLVSPTTAFAQVVAPGQAGSLSVTTDAGVTWRTVYTGLTSTGTPLSGPVEIPVTFGDQLHGFGADGLPPTDVFPSGSLYATSDGGTTWTLDNPPLPKAALPCPSEVLPTSLTVCGYGLPVFSDPSDAVVPALVLTDGTGMVGFDLTDNDGKTWTLKSTRGVTVPLPASPYS
ncbi:MAG: WD40/YVTN/BNR-like repeat-containing protein, partial [Acidimicrobiales bacterium]